MAAAGELPKLFTSDLAQNGESIVKLAHLQPKVVCFGHGVPLTEMQELAELAKRVSVHSAENAG